MNTIGNPTLLVLDCANKSAWVGLMHQSQYFSEQLHGKTHGVQLLSTITSLCTKARITPTNFDAIAFVAGPGSLTGLRLTHAMAQGLSLANLHHKGYELPLIALDSLALLGWQTHNNVYLHAKQRTCGWVIIDARMQRVYIAQLSSFCRTNYFLEGKQLPVSQLSFTQHTAQSIFYCGENDTKQALESMGYVLTVIDTTQPTYMHNVFAYAQSAWQAGMAKPPQCVYPRYIAHWQAT